MPLTQLNHFTVRTDDLDKTKDFYEKVLGMSVGFRPDLGFPGYWMYCEGAALVHLVPNENGLGGGDADNTGGLDHIAFSAHDFRGVKSHFETVGVTFGENLRPEINLNQLFLRDPNNVMIEINFRAVE
jgi:catechol 2,3-dioxygenase-like lactoylglutathione lyase family enzyme